MKYFAEFVASNSGIGSNARSRSFLFNLRTQNGGKWLSK